MRDARLGLLTPAISFATAAVIIRLHFRTRENRNRNLTAVKLMKTKELNLKVEGINLKGYLHKKQPGPEQDCDNSKKPLIILCHGIPRSKQAEDEKRKQQKEKTGDTSENEDGGYPALAALCAKEGFNAFHFNFRGTGESKGNFDLKGWTRDLDAFLEYLEENNYDNGKGFYLWGFSAGAAVSTYVVSKDSTKNSRLKGIALAACPAEFESLFPRDKLDEIIQAFRDTGILRDNGHPKDPEQWLEEIYSLNPRQYVKNISPTPLFIIHGDEDELIPYSQAYELYELAGEPKEIKIVPRAQHQLRKSQEAINKCLEWFKKFH